MKKLKGIAIVASGVALGLYCFHLLGADMKLVFGMVGIAIAWLVIAWGITEIVT